MVWYILRVEEEWRKKTNKNQNEKKLHRFSRKTQLRKNLLMEILTMHGKKAIK